MGIFIKASLIITLSSVFLFSVSSARAVGEANTTASISITPEPTGMVKTMPAEGAMKKVKLSQARLNICRNRSEKIGMRYKNMLGLGMKIDSDRQSIVTRVDTYYNSKLVSAGHTLSNYATLKADIATKQANVKIALDKAKASGVSFSCDSEDPRADADAFRANMQALIAANKEYKLAVRSFVVSVRDLSKSVNSPVEKGVMSPEPEETAAPVAQ